jgi:hypothetical protein
MFVQLEMMILGVIGSLLLASTVQADPKGYGDYDVYDDGGYGHHQNVIPVKKVVEYYVSIHNKLTPFLCGLKLRYC